MFPFKAYGSLLIIILSFCHLAQADECVQLPKNALPISSCSELQNINYDMQAHYYLTEDIDCSNFSFRPIRGSESFTVFSGQLNGCDKTISHLHIQQHDNPNDHTPAGLFMSLGPSAKITHLHFMDARVQSPDDTDRGLIAGKSENAILAHISAENITITHNETNTKDDGFSGGLVGLAINTLLSDVHLINSHVNKNAFAGGLIGLATDGTTIEKSRVTKLETSGKSCNNSKSKCGVGGLIGMIGPKGSVSNTEYDAVITESFAQGEILSDKNIGGLVGYIGADESALISNSYSNVILCDSYDGSCKYSGGIIGKAEEIDSDDIKIDLKNVYAIGLIHMPADQYARAIVGHKQQNGAYRINGVESYFDMDSTEKNNPGDSDSLGLTTKQMQSKSGDSDFHFSVWDTQIWQFSTDAETHYPRLKHFQ